MAGCRHGEGSAMWPGGQGGVELGGRGKAGHWPGLEKGGWKNRSLLL